MLSRYTFFGRRSSFRREAERNGGGYVDRYGAGLFTALFLLAVLNIMDACLTMHILQGGGWEVNPLVRWALVHFGETAWTLKIAVVSCGIVILCLHSRFRLARYSLAVMVSLYSGIVLYQFVLLGHLPL